MSVLVKNGEKNTLYLKLIRVFFLCYNIFGFHHPILIQTGGEIMIHQDFIMFIIAVVILYLIFSR